MGGGGSTVFTYASRIFKQLMLILIFIKFLTLCDFFNEMLFRNSSVGTIEQSCIYHVVDDFVYADMTC